jgi:hypothetical protein
MHGIGTSPTANMELWLYYTNLDWLDCELPFWDPYGLLLRRIYNLWWRTVDALDRAVYLYFWLIYLYVRYLAVLAALVEQLLVLVLYVYKSLV